MASYSLKTLFTETNLSWLMCDSIKLIYDPTAKVARPIAISDKETKSKMENKI